MCDRLGVTCVDPLTAFIELQRSQNVYFPSGDMHYRGIGHQVSADYLAQALKR
jgi:hypothetical protein